MSKTGDLLCESQKPLYFAKEILNTNGDYLFQINELNQIRFELFCDFENKLMV